MKTYSDFDKFLDKAKRISRYVLPGVAVVLMAGCTPEMLSAIITSPTPEVSPLPSDLTNTPTLSLTETPIELTPTVLNLAAVELTLVPKIESAKAVEDLRKLNEMLEVNKDIDNLVLAPEQVISDFYNKVIPNESDLRVSLSDMTYYYKIGEPFINRDGSVARVQATLMGGFTADNGGYLLLGTENAATGDRSIVPVQFTFGSEGLYSTLGIKKDNTQKRIMDYSGNITEFISAEALLVIVREYFGKNILFGLDFNMDINSPGILEEFKIIKDKYFLFERFESNKLYINDPFSIEKNNLYRAPWTNHLYY